MVKRIPVVMAASPDTDSLEARISKSFKKLFRLYRELLEHASLEK
jgi:hypothetical protein